MRTFDRVLADGLRPPFDPARWPAEAKAWRRMNRRGAGDPDRPESDLAMLAEARPVIVADDVAAAYHGGDGTAVEDLHCLAPPWPSFWVEYPSATGRQRRGAWVTDATGADRSSGGSFQGAIDDARTGGYSGEVRWLVDVALAVEDARHRCFGPVGWFVVALDPAGRAVGNRWVLATPRGAESVDAFRLLGSGAPVDPGWLLAAVLPALQTVALLHCRNVSLEPHRADGALDRRHRRRHGRPLVRWQTLRLDVPRRQTSGHVGNGRGDMVGVHVVAGNFHHYGDCCPGDGPGSHPPHGLLFGKLSGVYWVPGHARGSPTRGLVVTDWDVKVGEAGR